jgi:hypothetical protein
MIDHPQALDYVRRYDGVAPEVIADGSWLLARPAFWLSLLDGYADPDLLDTLFEGTGADPEALHEEVTASGRWPVLRLGAEPADLAMVYWHGPDDEGGYDYVVLPEGGRCISVAAQEGHGHGPGLSWPEAWRLAERGTLGTAAQRLFLMLPALGDADVPKEAVDTVAAALREVVNPACDGSVARELAEELLEDPARWSRQGEALVCDDEHSVRAPGGLPSEDLLLVSRALAG